MSQEEFFKAKVRGFTMVELMVVVAIIALLAILVMPSLLRARLISNETYARAILKIISNACESYAAGNYGQYPTAMADLIGPMPPYLNEDYTIATLRGYDFNCDTLAVSGYSCTATPASCGQTGIKIFTITTGAVLTYIDCS